MKCICKSAVSVILSAALVLPFSGCSDSNSKDYTDVRMEDGTKENSDDSAKESSEQKDNGKEEISSSAAAEHLLTVWSDYLGVLDHMYESELWAIDYTEKYLNSGDWEDLTKARTSCIASARYLTELSMSEEDLTAEEYQALAGKGIDTAYQSIEFQSVSGLRDDAHTMIRGRLLESLESDIFYNSSVELLKQEVAMQKEYILYMCQYACGITNYLLASLGDEIDAKAYWSAMEDSYPVLYTGCSEWLDKEDDLKAAVDAILDNYEAAALKYAEILSGKQAELYDMTQIVENLDITALMASAHRMTNVPELLPNPNWYNPMTTGYLSFVAAEDGDVTYPQSGDLLEDQTYGMYIEIKNINTDDISTYLDSIADIADSVWKEDGKDTWYIAMKDYNVQINWKDGTATILFNGADVTFAPVWYLSM